MVAKDTGSTKQKDDVSRAAREGMDAAKKKASEASSEATRQFEERGEEVKGRTADAMGSVARAMRSARGELNGDSSQFMGGLLSQAADGLEDMADGLDRRPPGEIVETIRNFGRRNPAVFVAGSVLAGFAVARLVGSSEPAEAARGPARQGEQTPPATFGTQTSDEVAP